METLVLLRDALCFLAIRRLSRLSVLFALRVPVGDKPILLSIVIYLKKNACLYSYTRAKGGSSTTRSREEEYLVKPFELMSLPQVRRNRQAL
jgi:hypothetical protein